MDDTVASFPGVAVVPYILDKKWAFFFVVPIILPIFAARKPIKPI